MFLFVAKSLIQIKTSTFFHIPKLSIRIISLPFFEPNKMVSISLECFQKFPKKKATRLGVAFTFLRFFIRILFFWKLQCHFLK